MENENVCRDESTFGNCGTTDNAEDFYYEPFNESLYYPNICGGFSKANGYSEYKAHQKKSFRLLPNSPFLLICYVIGATRFSLHYYGGKGPLFMIAFVVYLLVTTLFSVFLALHLVLFVQKDNRRGAIFKMCDTFITRGFGGKIEDFIAVGGIVVIGMYLIARVHAGQCAESTNIWESQTCNPVADSGSIPHDEVLLLYAIPIACQSILRGISVRALIISWALVLSFVVYSIMEVKGWLEIWTVLYSILFINISCETERFNRVMFIQSKALAHDTDRRLESEKYFKKRHAEDERKLKEQETLQLRSLMGNVAHDLKTPLHSIEADLEALCLFFSKVTPSLLAQVLAEFHKKCAIDSFDPLSICFSLNSSCKFMGMAINRSQDFVKASNNIPLIPSIETFELKVAIAMSVGCINQLQTARTIVVHPLPLELCPYIISDKHWVSENILCLLSNAMKFSESGSVDVKIRVVNDKHYTCNLKTSIQLYRGSRKNQELLEPTDQSVEIDEIMYGSNTNGDVEKFLVSEKMVLITVEDSGVGITEKAKENLFQPLQQTRRVAGGAGLGLYSLSKRIEALGGAVGMAPRTDGMSGSMFWFTFPYKPDDDAARNKCREDSFSTLGDPNPKNDSLGLRPMRVLVVDDSISILKVTSRLLMMNGHTVETASNGSIGLDMLKAGYENQLYDMILTDIQMPVMDGNEATKLFRRYEDERELESWGNSNFKKTRLLIVGMSANTDEQSRNGALMSGMDYFIAKPFAYRDLQTLLQSIQPDVMFKSSIKTRLAGSD